MPLTETTISPGPSTTDPVSRAHQPKPQYRRICLLIRIKTPSSRLDGLLPEFSANQKARVGNLSAELESVVEVYSLSILSVIIANKTKFPFQTLIEFDIDYPRKSSNVRKNIEG